MPMLWEIDKSDAIDEKIARDGYDSLSRPERLYHGVSWLLFVVYGPGFVQYFEEAPPEWVAAAREGLQVIGAPRMASLLNEAISFLPGGEVPPNESARGALCDNLSEDLQEAIEEVAARFTDEPYPEDLLTQFAEVHDCEFTCPRTELALWQSKMERGVDTTPRYVTKVMDFEIEAERDRPYSSRSCPHCGYPTPDYRPKCKRCDYPHGRA